MVNIYKLTNLLESGMTIFHSINGKTKVSGYPLPNTKRNQNEIEVVTNVFYSSIRGKLRFHIQLSANYIQKKPNGINS